MFLSGGNLGGNRSRHRQQPDGRHGHFQHKQRRRSLCRRFLLPYRQQRSGRRHATGEWYLNASTQTHYLWTPTGDSPANHVVEAKSRMNAFNLSGKSYIDIQGLSFLLNDHYQHHLQLQRHQRHLGNIRFGIHLRPELSGGWELGITLLGSYDTIENSLVAYSSGNGVMLEGGYSTAINNVIHNVDYLSYYCGAVFTGYSVGNAIDDTISDNTLYNSGRYLIYVDGMYSGSVDHNDVYDSMLQTWDGSAIKCTHGGASHGGTVIAYNTVHDAQDTANDAVGIYLDNGERFPHRPQPRVRLR